jgi:hypothetical protein
MPLQVYFIELKRQIHAATVFEVASVLGIALFHADDATLMMHSKLIDDKLSLLPREARKRKPEVDDDF